MPEGGGAPASVLAMIDRARTVDGQAAPAAAEGDSDAMRQVALGAIAVSEKCVDAEKMLRSIQANLGQYLRDLERATP